MTSPTGQSFFYGSSVPATALVAGGTVPYSVTYHYKLATAGSYTATAAVGPFYDPSTFTQTLGAFSVVGTYQVYATVTDGAAGTATSVTNTFAVSLTTGIAVQDANFETPGVLSGAPFWAHINPVWNPDTNNSIGNPYQQNSVFQSPQDGNEQFTFTGIDPGGIDWVVLLNTNTVSISQDLLASVNAGDTISLTFYGGRSQQASTVDGGVFTAAFMVGSTPYSMSVDTTVLATNSWQSYTLTQVITNSGDLSLQFSAVSGDPWLDNISVVRTIPPSPVSVPPVLGAPKVSGGNLILTGTGGTPNANYTWLSTTNLSAPITWTTNSTGTLNGAGAFTNSISITNRTSFFRLRLP
ncbi:MAG TPA: hypothetical protein DCQ92_18290 [Verrucomicrobia subdivision 3 bacterium]|nr:hypothetical protein [Limisphaerales bacterium]